MRPSGKAHCARAVASLDNRKIVFGCDRFAHCVFANSVLGCGGCSGRPCTAASPAWKPLSPPPPLDCAIRRATAWRNGLRSLGRNTVRRPQARCASHLRALPVQGAWPRAAVSHPARRYRSPKRYFCAMSCDIASKAACLQAAIAGEPLFLIPNLPQTPKYSNTFSSVRAGICAWVKTKMRPLQAVGLV